MWEACPTFETWIPGFDADVIPADMHPLLHLEAIPEDMRYRAVTSVTQCARWAVVGLPEIKNWTDKLAADRVFRHWDEQGREQSVLKAHSRKVYGKGWSLKGDKEQHQGGRLMLWSVAGHPKPRLQDSTKLPPVPPYPAQDSDLDAYISNLPSGRFLGDDGYHGWTDGSVRTTCKTAGAGV